MSTNKLLSFTSLTDYIESMIATGRYGPGEKLPSLRTLGQQFGLNVDTVRRGLWYLRDKGLLECHQGTGVFVRNHRKQTGDKTRIIVLLNTLDQTKTYSSHVFLGMQQEALTRQVILESHICMASENGEGMQQISELAAAGNGLILIGNYDLIEYNHPLPCPAVGVEMHEMFGGIFSTIALDPINAAKLAVEYFRSRKVKNVKVFSLLRPLHDFRAQMFMLYWKAAGGNAEYIIDEQDGERDISHLADSRAGYLFTGGDLYDDYAKKYRAVAGKPLNQERTVLSIDGKSRLLPGYEPVNSIYVDWQAAGRVALQEVLRRIKEPGTQAERIYLDTKISIL